jgi:hypothetical protein
MKRSLTAMLLFTLLLILSLSGRAIMAQEAPASKGGEQKQLKDLPPGNKVDGLELPEDQLVDKKDAYVDIEPKVDPTWKLERIDWIVVFASKEPTKFSERGSSLTVALPEAGESVFVYADALLSQEKEVEMEVSVEVAEGQWEKKKAKVPQKVFKKTKHAVTVITVKGGAGTANTGTGGPQVAPPGIAQPVGDPTPIPDGVGPLHVILVINQNNPSAVEKAISNSEKIRAKLAPGKHEFYPIDPTSKTAQRADLKAVIEKAGTPCLIVMNAEGKSLTNGQAIRFPMTNDPTKNEFLLLDIVGRVASGKK